MRNLARAKAGVGSDGTLVSECFEYLRWNFSEGKIVVSGPFTFKIGGETRQVWPEFDARAIANL